MIEVNRTAVCYYSFLQLSRQSVTMLLTAVDCGRSTANVRDVAYMEYMREHCKQTCGYCGEMCSAKNVLS